MTKERGVPGPRFYKHAAPNGAFPVFDGVGKTQRGGDARTGRPDACPTARPAENHKR